MSRRKLLIRGLDESITREQVEIHFQSRKKSGGSDVRSVDLDKSKPGEATVEFENDEVVDRVLNKTQIVKGCKVKLSVVPPNTASKNEDPSAAAATGCCTVLASGLSSETTEDALMCYFENERRSGGGEVQEVERTGSTASVTFVCPDVAERVARHPQHKIDGVLIKVVQSPSAPIGSDIENTRSVVVEGLGPNTTPDAILLYFENTRRSGGGEVESVEMTSESNSAIVTFKEAKDSHNVVAKGNHVIDGCQLKVSLERPTEKLPADPCKLHITGLSERTTRDTLMSFMEVATGLEVLGVDFGAKANAIVTFHGAPDLDKVLLRCRKRPLDGNTLTAESVPVCNCLLVTGLRAQSSRDSVLFYFESSRRSGGGEVDRVELHAEEGWALVFFESPKDAEKASQRKHEVDARELTVSMHQPLLAKTVTPSTAPREKKIDVHPEVMSFLCKAKANQLTELRDKKQLKVEWEDGATVVTLTSDSLTNSQWEESCQAFNVLIESVSTATVAVSPATWPIFQEKSTELCKSCDGSDRVDVELCGDAHQVVIIGENDNVDYIHQQLQAVKNDSEKELAMKASIATDELHDIPGNKLLLIDSCGFKEELLQRHKGLEMQVNREEGTINLRGPQVMLHSASKAIWSNLSKTSEVPVKLPPSSLNLVKTEPERLMKKFTEKGVKAVVVCEQDDDGNSVSVVGMSQNDTKQGRALLERAFVEKNIALSEDQFRLTKSQMWCQFKDALENCNVATISSDETSQNIVVTSLSDDVEELVSEIESFFADHTIVTQVIALSEGARRFIFKHRKDKLDTIQREFQSQSVFLKEKEDLGEIHLSGTAEGVAGATRKLRNIIDSIKEKVVAIDKPGMSEFLAEGKGAKLLSLVENENKCTIDRPRGQIKAAVTPQTTPPTTAPATKRAACSYTTPEGKKILVFEDDLTKHRVEVIVNGADANLRNEFGLAKAIVKAGGNEIQEECDKYLIDNGAILEGHVAVTRGGRLPCKRIIHAVGPTSQTRPLFKEKVLQYAITNALNEAAGDVSVAIPAISTGGAGFPRDVCAKVSVNTVLEFFQKNPKCSLSEVHFTDTDGAAIREFVKEMRARFKDEPSFRDGSGSETKEAPKPKGRRKLRKASAASSAPAITDDAEDLPDDPYAFITPEGIRVALMTGDLSKEKAHVLVNTTSSALNLSQNACARALSAVAGPTLQQECSAHGNVNEGNMAVTGGGYLACDHVFHVVCGGWDNGNGEKVLRKLIQKCLQELHDRGLQTIAIPAIGTGNLSFPRDRVASVSLEEACIFSQKNPTTTVKEVRYVVYDKDHPTVQAYQSEFKKRQPPKKKRGPAGSGVATGPKPTADTSEVFIDITEEDLSAATQLDPSNPQVLFGSVSLEVRAGDITKESTEAIVIASNKDLDLAVGGGVGAAILRAGGQSIQTECFAAAKQAISGNVARTGAGDLKPTYIYHMIPAALSEASLKDCLLECLRTADGDGVSSISLPAIGTGNYGLKPKSAAKKVLSAVESFSREQPQSLTSINVVVFQQSMLEDYHNAMRAALAGKSSAGLLSKVSSLIGGIQGYFGYGRGTPSVSAPAKASAPPGDVNCLKIYAGSSVDISNAEKAVQTLIKENYKQQQIVHEAIAKLSPADEQQILILQRQYDTKIVLEKTIGRIVIHGSADGLLVVATEIYEILNKAMEQEHSRGFAELLCESIQWYYFDDDQAEPYEKDLNVQIENAFKRGDASVIVSDQDDKYEIVFADNVETNLVTGGKTKVVRRELGKGIALPDNWAPQPTDSTGKEKEVHLVQLAAISDEFKKVAAEVAKTATLNIVKIERVQNPTLYKAYVVKRQRMDEKDGSREKQLFHGTAGASCTNINSFGFNRSFCGKNATVFGNGVYFARDASYSAQSTYSPPDGQGNRFLYLARVLVGDYTKGRHGLLTPPPKASGVAMEAYDTVVDNTSNPSIFVVFYDTQCYPDYIITFK